MSSLTGTTHFYSKPDGRAILHRFPDRSKPEVGIMPHSFQKTSTVIYSAQYTSIYSIVHAMRF